MSNALERISKVAGRRGKPMQTCFFDQNGLLQRVTCKLCGVTLQAMATSSRQTKREGDRLIEIERQRLMPTTRYDVLRIVMRYPEEEGKKSNHDTPICTECKRQIQALEGPKLEEVLEEIYCCDLFTWVYEEKEQGLAKIPWETLLSAQPYSIDRNV